MDSLNSQGMNGTHSQQPHNAQPYTTFMEDMHSYPGTAEHGPSDDFGFAWDPALFTADNIGSPFSHQQPSQQPQQPQQQQPQHQNYAQVMSRQPNNNPALPQFQHSQNSPSPYPQNSYQPHPYEARSSSQPSFDDRFLARPSNSPAPFEQFHHYQPPIQFNSHAYPQVPQSYTHAQQQQQQPRREPSPNTQHLQHQRMQQQNTPQYMNIAPARPSSQLQQMQGPSTMYHQFQAKPPVQHNFVDPSMLSAGSIPHINGNISQMASRVSLNPFEGANNTQQFQTMQQPPYYQGAGAAMDPQLLQHARVANVSPSPISGQVPMQPNLGPTNIHTNIMHPSTQQIVGASKPPGEPDVAKKPKVKSTKATKNSGDQDSADELEIEEEPPEMPPAILSVSAPTEFRSKILYNIVQAVWSPRNKPATTEKVRSGVAAYGDTIRQLRDAWKEKNEALKKAELPNSSAAAEVPGLKNDVAQFRSTLEIAMQRTLQYGHDSIVKRLGENHFTLSALYSIMLDRVHAGDWDSSLVTSIFRLAIRFETLDEEMLETVKWSKILQRLSKKATNDSKDLAKKILANAATQTAKKKAAKSEDGPGSPASGSGGKSAIGVKRARDGDAALPVPKKIVKPASKPLALQHAERRKALEKENAAKAKVDKDGKPTAGTTAKPKVAVAAPIKSSAFAGLLSASKKPGTSIAEKAAAMKDKPKTELSGTTNGQPAAASKDEPRKPSPPRGTTPASTKATSSFLGFLAQIEKPKTPEVQKQKEIPDETEEERTKRLRKEARRKLRVSWKPDNDLVETRLFTHDPEEETGHADSMMRDAGDTVKEGEMLKLHKGIDDLDDDDDEEDEAIDDLIEYKMPTEVDFSVIDQDCALNFSRFGGPLNPVSPASEAQDKYEENTLMAIYTFKSDRPDTPKELPSVNEEDDFSPSIDFGEPADVVRNREKEILARRQPPSQTPKDFDLAAQLRAMTQQQQQQPQQPQPAGGFDLQRTLSLLGQQSQPAAVPTAPVAGGLDLAKLLAVVQQANQMHQNQPQPQPQPQPQYNTPQPPVPNVPANLAAIVAQVQQNQSIPTGSGGNPNPFPGTDFNRKHDRSDDQDNLNKRKKSKVPLGPDGKPLNYKTQVCHFYKEGKCIKGDNCTYRHDD